MTHSQPSNGLSSRQQRILDHARKLGEVGVDALAETFSVSTQTIRRDLNYLCSLRLLQRIHGGAIVQDGVANLGYGARRRIAVDAKDSMGACAAALIPDDSSLFINIGTTTEYVAKHLTSHLGLLVVTNNINVVTALRGCENIDIMMAGGSVRRDDGAIIGGAAVDFIRQFKVDFAIIGTSAVDEDGTLLDYDPREVRVAKAIVENARSVILVADSMKFERSAPIRITSIADVDYFITDKMPGSTFVDKCYELGVSIKIAESNLPETAANS